MVEGCKHVELKIMVGWFLWVSYILTLNKLGNLEKQIWIDSTWGVSEADRIDYDSNPPERERLKLPAFLKH